MAAKAAAGRLVVRSAKCRCVAVVVSVGYCIKYYNTGLIARTRSIQPSARAPPSTSPSAQRHFQPPSTQHPAPVKPATFHILASLAGEARHGLGIVRDVLDQTDGALQLWPATLYGALEQLADEGLIEELGEREHPVGESEKRRYYRLTRTGRAAMLAEVKRLEQLAAMARGRLAAGGARAR